MSSGSGLVFRDKCQEKKYSVKIEKSSRGLVGSWDPHTSNKKQDTKNACKLFNK